MLMIRLWLRVGVYFMTHSLRWFRKRGNGSGKGKSQCGNSSPAAQNDTVKWKGPAGGAGPFWLHSYYFHYTGLGRTGMT